MSAILLPYQQRWIADKSPVKIIEKGRRIGLSYGEAADSVLHAADAERGANVYYISYDKEMTSGFIKDCATWAKAFHTAAGSIGEKILKREDGKDIHVYDIRFDSGYAIETFSSNPRNLRSKGRPRERLVLDEAAFVDDLEELLKAAIAMTMWGGTVHIISTHNGAENPFNVLIQDARAGRNDYSIHRVTLDDAINEGLYRRICEVTGKPWSLQEEMAWRASLVKRYSPNHDEELFCVPAQGSGAFLSRALVERCMSPDIPVLRLELKNEFTFLPEHRRISETEAWCEDHLAPLLEKLQPGRRSYFGEDFARKGDLSIYLPVQEQQNATFAAPFGLELKNVPFETQRQVVFYICDRLPMFTHGAFDARGNGQYLAEVAAQKYGPDRISQVMLTEAWYRDNMPRYKAAFEDETLLLPLDADWIEDNRAFKMVKGVAKLPDGKTESSGGQRHGDAGVAGAMVVYATRQGGGGIIEYQSTGERRSSTDMSGFMGR
jgi:phage FluMu gp28-like protein